MLYQIGLENFSIVAKAQSVTINDGHNQAFTIRGVTDAWAKNINIYNTVNSVSLTGKRITAEEINISHEVPTVGAAKPADLNGSGQQLLFNKCTIQGVLWFCSTAPSKEMVGSNPTKDGLRVC
jgi:hypothetical protein